MRIVTLEEAKRRLSYEYQDAEKDADITSMTNGIESYLVTATGKEWENAQNKDALALAKEYVLTSLYIQYYNIKDDTLSQSRLTAMMKQLQVLAYEP